MGLQEWGSEGKGQPAEDEEGPADGRCTVEPGVARHCMVVESTGKQAQAHGQQRASLGGQGGGSGLEPCIQLPPPPSSGKGA